MQVTRAMEITKLAKFRKLFAVIGGKRFLSRFYNEFHNADHFLFLLLMSDWSLCVIFIFSLSHVRTLCDIYYSGEREAAY